ncbi:hypothetical protein AOLI_G00141900 [Acnodon oligacanthus]
MLCLQGLVVLMMLLAVWKQDKLLSAKPVPTSYESFLPRHHRAILLEFANKQRQRRTRLMALRSSEL